MTVDEAADMLRSMLNSFNIPAVVGMTRGLKPEEELYVYCERKRDIKSVPQFVDKFKVNARYTGKFRPATKEQP